MTPRTLLTPFQAQYYLECGDSSPLSAAATRRSVKERTRGKNIHCTVKFWGVATRGSFIGEFDSLSFVLEHENTYPSFESFCVFRKCWESSKHAPYVFTKRSLRNAATSRSCGKRRRVSALQIMLRLSAVMNRLCERNTYG